MKKRKLFTLGLTVFMTVSVLCSNVAQASGMGSMPEVTSESYVAQDTSVETVSESGSEETCELVVEEDSATAEASDEAEEVTDGESPSEEMVDATDAEMLSEEAEEASEVVSEIPEEPSLEEDNNSSEEVLEESSETSSNSEEESVEISSDVTEEGSEELAEDVTENSEEIASEDEEEIVLEDAEENEYSEIATEEESTEQNESVEVQDSSEEISEISTEEIVSEEIIAETSEDDLVEVFVMPTESVWTSENFEVKHSIINYWEGGYQGEVVITNIGDTTIEDWNLMFEMDTDIYQIWNASIDSDENGLYIIKNDNWNANISAGQSRSFGYLASYENAFTLPENYGISGSEKELAGDSYEITYEVTDMWEDGYVGNITITNLSDKELRNWKLSFDLDDEICDIWNATIHSNENGQYVLHHAEHNAVIGAGGSVTIGFRVQDNELQMYPENYAVKVIVQSTMRSDLRDDVIGVAYFEELKAEDYRIEDDGIQYVANQLNLVGKDGVTFDQIADLGTEYEFEIVGYIEFTNDYQVKFVNDKTYEELNELMAELGQNELILEAELNLVSTIESNYEKTDTTVLPNDRSWASKWDGEIGDINWGVEAINALGAWQYEEYMTTVKMGIYDNMFDESQDDLKFAKVWNNWTPEQAGTDWSDHGTHVAGTMAAEYNNGFGIAGIAIKKELYAYALSPKVDEISGQIKTTTMDYKYAFALLIGHGARVVNMSVTTGKAACVAASNNIEKARNYIDRNANVMDSFLQRLVNRGYDFVIVVAAGNENNKWYIKDIFSDYGYIKYDGKYPEEDGAICGNVQAQYSNFLARMTQIKDRVIVVGAYGMEGDSFKYADFSCVGDRVDIVAPGVNICSSVSNDLFASGWQGTSMATPHVSGVAGLAYSVNPSLSGMQVKELIVKYHNNIAVTDQNKKVFYSVDAQRVVEEALKLSGNTPVIGESTAFILGRVVSVGKEPLSGIDVTANRYSTSDENIREIEDCQYTTTTDENGEFSLAVTPGTYRILLYNINHKPLIIEEVTVDTNEVKYLEEIMYVNNSFWGDVVVEGEVINAVDGLPVASVDIGIRAGWNNYLGEIIENREKTDINGVYSINLKTGYYTLEFSKEGYITAYLNIIAYQDVPISKAVICPQLADNEMRVVLTWGDKPYDLDSYLMLKDHSNNSLLIYYGNKTYFDKYNQKYYKLDVDDTFQYGPETITFYVDNQEISEYRYYVHNYSGGINGDELSYSGAKVTVYYGTHTPQVYNVPINQMGYIWNVFSIIDGNILVENTISK